MVDPSPNTVFWHIFMDLNNHPSAASPQPPLLARRSNRLDLPSLLLPPFGRGICRKTFLKRKRLPGGSLLFFEQQARNEKTNYSFFWTSDCPFEEAAFFSMLPGLTRVVVFTLIRASIFA